MEKYLRNKKLQRPMLGAQRRIEARIGQLLGKPEKGGRGKRSVTPEGIDKDDRSDFRNITKSPA